MNNFNRILFLHEISILRQLRGLTQKQVAVLAGLSESISRSYKLGNRNRREMHFEKVAQTLEVSPDASKDFSAATNEQAAQVLFQIQTGERPIPQIIGGKPCLTPPLKNEPLEKPLGDWGKKETRFKNSRIAKQEYEKKWKISHSFKTRDV